MRVSGHFANVFIWGDRFCNSSNILMWTTSNCHRSLISQASAYHLVFTGSPVNGAEGLRGGWMWSNSPGNWFHTGGASCDHWLRRGCAFLQRGLRLTGSLWADNWSKRDQRGNCHHCRTGKKEVSKPGRPLLPGLNVNGARQHLKCGQLQSIQLQSCELLCACFTRKAATLKMTTPKPRSMLREASHQIIAGGSAGKRSKCV